MLADQFIDGADVILRCATGHHGKPPSTVKNGTRIQARRYFNAPDINAGREWIGWATAYFRPSFPSVRSLEDASWWIAGVITLADWLGSNRDWFPYRQDVADPALYYDQALLQADQAITESGVVMPMARRCFADIFPGYTPTPVQQAVLELPVENWPFLLVIEETTGAKRPRPHWPPSLGVPCTSVF